jgi:hypothetical protein
MACLDPHDLPLLYEAGELAVRNQDALTARALETDVGGIVGLALHAQAHAPAPALFQMRRAHSSWPAEDQSRPTQTPDSK